LRGSGIKCKELCQVGFEIDYNAPGEYVSLHHKLLGRLAVHISNELEHNTGALPYFVRDDIHATITELKKRELRLLNPPERARVLGLRIFSITSETVGALRKPNTILTH